MLFSQVGLADNNDISENNAKVSARSAGEIRFITNLLLIHSPLLIDAVNADLFTCSLLGGSVVVTLPRANKMPVGHLPHSGIFAATSVSNMISRGQEVYQSCAPRQLELC